MTQRISAVEAAVCVTLFAGGCATTSFRVSTLDGAVKAGNAFGFDLYRAAKAGRGNFVCSPAGAAIALTMAAAGARGETQAEMLHALHAAPADLDQAYRAFASVLTTLISRDGEDGLVLDLANRVWVQKDLRLRPHYVSLLRDVFRAPLAEVDFKTDREAALLAINQWGSQQTHGRIPQILAKVNPKARMVLVNAVYMMGEWQQPFVESATHDGKFTTAKEVTTVKMMRQVSRFRYAQVRGAKLVELPYKGGLSMVVVLPTDVDGLEKIEDRLGGSYADWIGALEYKEVDLELPRFTVATELALVGLLMKMGIRRAFKPDLADFSGMTEEVEARLFIGDAIQKAWIGTDENGTEAAAVTAVVMEVHSIGKLERLPPPPPVIFHANHPFLYLIRDVKSGGILFLGRIVEPSR